MVAAATRQVRPIRMRAEVEEALVKATVTPEESVAVAMWEAAEVEAAVVQKEAEAPRRLARRAHRATVWTERNVKGKAAVRAFLFPAAVSRWEEAPTAAMNVGPG